MRRPVISYRPDRQPLRSAITIRVECCRSGEGCGLGTLVTGPLGVEAGEGVSRRLGGTESG